MVTSKPKTLFSTGRAIDIVCNYCKEKGHMVKDCKKLKKKKEKDAQKSKPTQKKVDHECGTCGKKIILKNDVGKAQERISSLNVLGLKTHWITTQNRRYKNHNTTQQRLAPSPLPRRMIKTTYFATTLT